MTYKKRQTVLVRGPRFHLLSVDWTSLLSLPDYRVGLDVKMNLDPVFCSTPYPLLKVP